MTFWSTPATTASIRFRSLGSLVVALDSAARAVARIRCALEVLQTRTREVAEEEAARLRSEYRKVLRRREDVVVLDAGQSLDELSAEAERAIVAQLARRTARRLGLPDTSKDNPTSTDVLLFFCRRHVPVLSKLIRVLFNSDIHCRLPGDVHMPHPYGIVLAPTGGHRSSSDHHAAGHDRRSRWRAEHRSGDWR